jgi:signal transduction histidine kinase
MNLNLESFNLHETLEEVLSISSPLAGTKALALFIEPDSDRELEIFADRTRIRQVMLNLVNNALKFTDEGSVRICAERRDESVLISVRDTGMGIPPDKLQAIFQEFTQVDTSATRRVGGSGLGLPISRKLLDMHGGRIWAESTGLAGEGAALYVELPVKAQIAES